MALVGVWLGRLAVHGEESICLLPENETRFRHAAGSFRPESNCPA